MFSPNSPTLGVILAILFIIAVTWFVIHKTKALIAQEKILFVLIFLISILTATWVADRVIAFNIQLLTPEESKEVFGMIKYILATVLGYYFGTKKNEPEK